MQKKIAVSMLVISVTGALLWAGYTWAGKALDALVKMHGG